MKTALIILFVTIAFVVNAQTPVDTVYLPIVKIEEIIEKVSDEVTTAVDVIRPIEKKRNNFDNSFQRCVCVCIMPGPPPPLSMGIQIRHHLNISYWD